MSLDNYLRYARELLNPDYRSAMMAGLRAYRRTPDNTICPLCGYTGKFTHIGVIPRFGAGCPKCGSAERHRLLALAHDRGFFSFKGKRILHFAPEPIISNLINANSPATYDTADILPGRASLVIDITAIALPDNSRDLVLASHVLEHVDDSRALGELYRILSPGGQAIIMVPLIDGWQATYENADVKTDEGRFAHFGKDDHIRYYGSDLRERLRKAGFALEEFTAEGADCATYALERGDKVFRLTKPQG